MPTPVTFFHFSTMSVNFCPNFQHWHFVARVGSENTQHTPLANKLMQKQITKQKMYIAKYMAMALNMELTGDNKRCVLTNHFIFTHIWDNTHIHTMHTQIASITETVINKQSSWLHNFNSHLFVIKMNRIRLFKLFTAQNAFDCPLLTLFWHLSIFATPEYIAITNPFLNRIILFIFIAQHCVSSILRFALLILRWICLILPKPEQ